MCKVFHKLCNYIMLLSGAKIELIIEEIKHYDIYITFLISE
ncbi:hypothetical protein EVA_11622 [gut metagenome]|uniref:Uncharacterized protein n=1 Tax=gut metagenome TaxID=749906 RepID=J9GKQ7_9ZZZZ